MVLGYRKVILTNWHLEWLLLFTQGWQDVGDVLWARLRIGRKNGQHVAMHAFEDVCV